MDIVFFSTLREEKVFIFIRPWLGSYQGKHVFIAVTGNPVGHNDQSCHQHGGLDAESSFRKIFPFFFLNASNICNKIYELILSTHPRFRIQSNIGFPIFLFGNFTFVWWGAMMPSNHAGILTCSFSLPTSDSQEISLKNDLSCDGMCGMIGISQASYHRQSDPFGFPSETSRFRTESNGFCLEYRRGFAYVMYACHENHEFSSKNLIVSKVFNYYRFRALRNPRIPYF